MRYPRVHACLVGAVALMALGVGPGATSARAQEAAAPSAVPTLTSATANAGGGTDVSGGGCAARASVQIQFDGAVLVTTRSDGSGNYHAHLIVPVSAVPGSHRITVVCAGPSGGQVSNATTVTVGLPRTGANDEPLIAVALFTVLLGATLAASHRRRLT